jgi:3-dehydroquinate dehydratase-2
MPAKPEKAAIGVLHGPNLNRLGQREPEVYGRMTLADIDKALVGLGDRLNLRVETFQSNHEGELIEKIQQAAERWQGLIINPAAYSHTSIGIRDALAMLDIPIVEVHLSNIYRRESFRHHSLLSAVVTGQISGLGWRGYLAALDWLAAALKNA